MMNVYVPLDLLFIVEATRAVTGIAASAQPCLRSEVDLGFVSFHSRCRQEAERGWVWPYADLPYDTVLMLPAGWLREQGLPISSGLLSELEIEQTESTHIERFRKTGTSMRVSWSCKNEAACNPLKRDPF